MFEDRITLSSRAKKLVLSSLPRMVTSNMILDDVIAEEVNPSLNITTKLVFGAQLLFASKGNAETTLTAKNLRNIRLSRGHSQA